MQQKANNSGCGNGHHSTWGRDYAHCRSGHWSRRCTRTFPQISNNDELLIMRDLVKNPRGCSSRRTCHVSFRLQLLPIHVWFWGSRSWPSIEILMGHEEILVVEVCCRDSGPWIGMVRRKMVRLLFPKFIRGWIVLQSGELQNIILQYPSEDVPLSLKGKWFSSEHYYETNKVQEAHQTK